MNVRPVIDAAVDLLYPPRCAGCGRFGTFFCHTCESACIPALGAGRCPNCAARWDGSGNCPRCFDLQAIEGIRAAFEMTGPARRIVHRLKYGRMRAAAPAMARHLAPVVHDLEFDYATPVPLHRSRLRARGFNQAGELLAPLGLQPLPGELRRVINTGQQVGHSMRERRQNISGAFAYRGPSLEGKTILLVDDVVTTGATVHACANVLRDHGAAHVLVAAFARTSYEPGIESPIGD